VIDGGVQVRVRLWDKCYSATLAPFLERSTAVTQRGGMLVQLYMQPRCAPELHWLSLDVTALPALQRPPKPPASVWCASTRPLGRASTQGQAAEIV
jgi:hypothetical protein